MVDGTDFGEVIIGACALQYGIIVWVRDLEIQECRDRGVCCCSTGLLLVFMGFCLISMVSTHLAGPTHRRASR